MLWYDVNLCNGADAAHAVTFDGTGTGALNYSITVLPAVADVKGPVVTVMYPTANANIVTQSNNATAVFVHTYDTSGSPANEPFSIAIICPRGEGGGQTFPYTLP